MLLCYVSGDAVVGGGRTGCRDGGGWGGVAEPIEEIVQVIGSLHTSPLWAGPGFVSIDGSNTFPDIPHVVFLQLLLHFLPVAVFCLLQAAFHLPLCCFHLLLVLAPEGLLLLVKDSLDSLCLLFG